MKTPENDQIAPNQLEIKCFIWFSGCVLLIKCVSYNDNNEWVSNEWKSGNMI